MIWLLNLFAEVYNFVSTNWSVIEPIFLGIATAVGLYTAALTINNVVTGAAAFAKSVHAAAIMMESGATFAATAAQYGFNAALLACPITWILLIIIAVIVAIYAIVAAINKVTGSTMSATGIIAGSIAAVIAFIYNLFLGLLDLIFGIVNYWVNLFSTFVNFFANVFKNPISSVIYLFQGLADNVLGVIEKIASAMDYVFGSKMADTVANWRSGLKAMADDAVAKYAPNENYQKVMNNLDLSTEKLGLNRLEYKDTFGKGYKWGEGAEDKVGKLFDGLIPPQVGNNDSNTTVNAYVTGGGLDKEVDISNQSLEYLNDIAENKALKQFDAISAQMEVITDDSKLSETDREMLMNAAGATTRVYYLSYAGGVNMSNNINKGENWEDIKQKLKEETQSEIDVGISDLEGVVLV